MISSVEKKITSAFKGIIVIFNAHVPTIRGWIYDVVSDRIMSMSCVFFKGLDLSLTLFLRFLFLVSRKLQ